MGVHLGDDLVGDPDFDVYVVKEATERVDQSTQLSEKALVLGVEDLLAKPLEQTGPGRGVLDRGNSVPDFFKDFAIREEKNNVLFFPGI